MAPIAEYETPVPVLSCQDARTSPTASSRAVTNASFTRSFALDFYGTAPRPIVDHVAQLEPAAVFGRPAFWIGLVLAAAFLGIAIRVRRDREPL